MQEMTHPTDERLEAFCDGSLPATEQGVIDAHLVGCARCRSEVEDWRSLFSAIAALPALSPAPGFAQRVMAHVRIPQPRWKRAGALVSRFLPHTTSGWAAAVALLAVPLLALGTFAVWLLSRSYVTVYRLWVFSTDQFAAGANQAASGAFSRLIHTDITVWLITNVTRFMDANGVRGVSVLAAAAAGVILMSSWVLYRFLFRTPNRGSSYASFMF